MASMQRTWRRIWRCERPAWQGMARFNLLKRRKQLRRKAEGSFVIRNKKLTRRIAASIAALQLLSGGLNSAYAASNITIDNRTATKIDVKGNVTNIHTDTFRGQNAFNSFKDFNVSKGDIVNLYFSNSSNTMTANNLLNYVSGGNASMIDGVLNGIKNGQIGGNMFFLNPYGIMVGKTGVVNVGKLTAVTPSQSSIDDFLNNKLNGQANDSSYWTNFNPAEWSGTMPLSADGSIVIQGKVNAINGLSMRSKDITNSGTISSGASFTASQPDFSDVVNANGLASGDKIAVDGGTVEIIASNNIINSGSIVNEGSANQKGGTVNLKAENDITLSAGSQVSVKGNGVNSGGGTVTVVAKNNAYIKENALIDASGGASGNGGNIEFSGSKEVAIDGGSFKAGAANGKSGKVLIDPDKITWTGSSYDKFNNDGTSYELKADDSITLNDVVISTRKVANGTDRTTIETADSNGDSGDITLTAPHITLGADTKLLADANNGFKGGNVTMEASDSAAIDYAGYKEASASIQVGDENGGATIKGANVDLHAIATAENDYIVSDGTVGQQAISIATTTLSTALSQWAAKFTGIDATYSKAKTSAAITIKAGSQIKADDKVTMKAETVSGAGSRPLSLPDVPQVDLSLPFAIGVEYAAIDAAATVNVEKGANITAKDLTILTHNDANLDTAVSAESDNGTKKFSDFAVALGITDVTVNADSTVAGTIHVSGNVDIGASNTGSYSTSVDSSTSGTGNASAAIALASRQTHANATLTGDVQDATNVAVMAANLINGDSTTASTQSGITISDSIKGKLETGAAALSDPIENTIVSLIDVATSPAEEDTSLKTQSFRVSGAVAYANTSDTASAVIGGGSTAQTVHATGSVAAGSEVNAQDTNISATAAAVSDSKNKSTGDTTKQSYSAGVAYGTNKHSSLAEIGKNVTITAGNIGLASKTIMPIRDADLFSGDAFNQSTTLSTITSSLEALKGIGDVFNGQSSAKSTTNGDASSIGMSGSASILSFENDSQAVVDTGAKLNLTGNSTGSWQTDAIQLDDGQEAGSVTIGGKTYTYRDPVDPTTMQFTFDKQADIQAANDTTLLFMGGAVIPSGSGDKGLGMVLNDISVTGNVQAIVREGAVIQGVTETNDSAGAGQRIWTQAATGSAQEVAVNANNSDKVISIVSSSGMGSTFGLNGSMALTSVTEHTDALVDDEATVDALHFGVDAKAAPVVWSISGAVNISKGASVGVGVVYNDVSGETEAEIADNDTLSTDGNARVSQDDIKDALITSPDVAVEAHTGGNIGAIAVTPSIANSSDTSGGFLSSIKDTFDKLKTTAAKVIGEKPQTVRGSVSEPAKPSFGLAGAGSAAVNDTSIQNTAVVDHVTIEQKEPAGYTDSASLTVRGTTDTAILAASGAAAVTRANSSTQKTKVGITGSVAVNMVGNGNSAILSNSTLVDAGDVNVQALSSGDQVSVALGMGIDASKQGAEFTGSANGSVSLTFDQFDQTDPSDDSSKTTKNYTKALIKNTTITGAEDEPGRDVQVTAYNSTTVGTGGGSLELAPLSSDATGGGVGAAVTYADISRDVTGEITGSTITKVDAVEVNALNAGKIGAAGATASLTNDENTVMLAGTAVVSQINNHTTASVNGKSDIEVTDKVAVSAKNRAKDTELEKLIDTSPRAAENMNYNALGTLTGDGIISVAGTVQGSKGGNAGVSIDYSKISDNLLAEVKDSTAKTTAVKGTIDVTALSDASIMAMAAGVGASTNGFSGGGSITISEITNSVKAYVGQSETDGFATALTSNHITVDANDQSTIKTLAGEINLSKSEFAIGAAVTFNDIQNTVAATVDDAALHAASMTETDGSKVVTPGLVEITGVDQAQIDSIAAAGALAAGDTAPAISGSLTFNVIKNMTTGEVINNSVIDANLGNGDVGTDKVTVSADDVSAIRSLAGTLAASGGEAAVGGAAAYNTITNTNTANVDHAAIKDATEFTLTSQENATIETLSAAVSGAQTAALSGSLSINEITNQANANFTDSSLTGNTAVDIEGKDTATIKSLAGAAAISGDASIGGSIAVNTIHDTAGGTIENSTLSDISALTLLGENTAAIKSMSVSGSGAADGAFAGSSAANTTTNTTKAGIKNSAIEADKAKVNVTADNTATVETLAGGVAVAEDAGIGLAVAVNHIGNETDAYVDGSKTNTDTNTTTTYNVKNLNISSTSGGTIESEAVGVGGSVDVGVAGSTAANYISSNTKAYITNGAQVFAQDNVGVIAKTDDVITNLAGAEGLGATVAGVGASVTVNVISGETSAVISDTNDPAGGTGTKTEVTALAKDAGDQLTVSDGKLTGSVNLQDGLDLKTKLDKNSTDVKDKTLQLSAFKRADLEAMRSTKTVRGVAVNATATHSVENYDANIAGGEYAGVAGTTNTNVIKGTTSAVIGSARINPEESGVSGSGAQEISVIAGDHAYSNGFVGTVAVSLVGVGAGADTNVFSNTTKAYIQNSPEINAAGGVNIDAESSQGTASLAVSGSIAGIAVAGTSSVGIFNGTTEAYLLDDSDLDAGSIKVTANHSDGFSAVAGAVVVGCDAYGGTFAVVSDDSTVKAHIDKTSVHTNGAVAVASDNLSAIDISSVSGSGAGMDAVAGNAVVSLVGNTSEAYVTDSTLGADNSKTSDIAVTADNAMNVTHTAGTAAIAEMDVGVGATASVISLQNTTAAYLNNSTAYTSGKVTVEAETVRNIDNTALTAGVGNTVGLSGTAAITLIGQTLSEDGNGVNDTELDKKDKDGKQDGTLSKVDAYTNSDRLTNDNTSTGSYGGMSAEERKEVNDAVRLSVKDMLSPSDVSQAKIGKTSAAVQGTSEIHADGNVKITANEYNKTKILAGALGVGTGIGVGVGGSVGVLDEKNTIEATVQDTAKINAAQNIEINAASGNFPVTDSTTNIITYDPSTNEVTSYQGAAGAVALGAAVAIADVTNNVRAQAGQGTQLSTTGGGIDIKALDDSQVKAEAQGYTAAGVAAVGAVVADAYKRGDTKALVGDEGAANTTSITADAGAITLQSDRMGNVTATSTAGAGGIFAGSGSDAEAKDNGTTEAGIGDKVTAKAVKSAVKIIAAAKPQVSATAHGYTGSLYGSAGVSVANAEATPTVNAFIGSDGSVDAKTLTVNAQVLQDDAGDPTTKSHAEAVSGALLIGADATISSAISTAKANAYVDSDMNITDSAEIKANTVTSQDASSTGYVGGIAAIGANLANAVSNTTTTAKTGDITATGGDYTIYATGSDTNKADATAGSGGVIAGAASKATTDSNSTTAAKVGDGSGSAKAKFLVDSLAVNATHKTDFRGLSNSIQAAVAGFSGSLAQNTVNSTVDIGIGKNAMVVTMGEKGLNLGTDAGNSQSSDNANSVIENGSSSDVTGGAGGVLNGAAVKSSNTVNETTTLTVGDGASLSVLGTPFQDSRSLRLNTQNYLRTTDGVSLTTGGAIESPYADTDLTATIKGKIAVGPGVQMISVGTMGIGSFTDAQAGNTSLVNTYGGVSVAGGHSNTKIDSSNDIGIGDGDYLLSYKDMEITAGQSGDGKMQRNNINAHAVTDVYNYSFIPINTTTYANAAVNDNNTVTIGNGAGLSSVNSIVLADYDGNAAANAQGSGHNPYLELGAALGISKDKTDDSHTSTSTDSMLTVDGTVQAGIFHDQAITIGSDGAISHSVNDTILQDQLQSLADQLSPFALAGTASANTALSDVALIENRGIGISTTNGYKAASALQATLDDLQSKIDASKGTVKEQEYQAQWDALNILTGSLQDNVTALTIGDLYAAGGNITVNAGTVTGSGSLTAYGAPKITIDNASTNYLLLNSMLIPDQDTGGAVQFTGRAATAPAGLTVSEQGKGQTSQISVKSTSTSQQPAIIVNGAMDNQRGGVYLLDQSGSVAQFATISAGQIQIEVPNGSYVVNNPDGYWFSNADSMAVWSNGASVFAYDSSKYSSYEDYLAACASAMANGEVLPDSAQLAVYLAVNSWAQSQYSTDNITTYQDFYSALNTYLKDPDHKMYPADKDYADPFGSTYVVNNFPNIYKGDATGDIKLFGGYKMNGVPYLQNWLSHTANANDSKYSGKGAATSLPAGVSQDSSGALLVGGNIGVNAKYIDINGTIKAGVTRNWSIDVSADLDQWISSNTGKTGLLAIPTAYLTTLDSGDKLIGASYDFTNKRIVVDDINIPGTYVYLHGTILSTNTLGNIQVASGFGNINIQNDSSSAMAIGNLNTGSTGISTVKIADVLYDDKGVQTDWYVYQPGSGLSHYQSLTNSTAYTNDDLKDFSADNYTATYNPESGLRYQWVKNASLARDWSFNSNTDFYGQSQPGEWHWVNNPDGTRWTTATSVIKDTSQSAYFTQKLTGDISTDDLPVAFKDQSKGVPDESYDSQGNLIANWTYHILTGASITSTSSVKADNPFTIQFVGSFGSSPSAPSTAGGITVTSKNGGVLLNGDISNTSGNTSINAAKDAVTTGSGEMIATKDLTVTAKSGIGSTTDPLRLAATGSLKAVTDSGDIVIAVPSGDVTLAGISAGGNVILSADGNIVAAASALSPVVRGENITLVSTHGGIGSSSQELIIQPEASRVDGATVNGTLTAAAQDDIYLTQPSGDMRVNTITSEAGDISLKASAGKIVSAVSGTLSDQQIKSNKAALGVGDATTAQTNTVETLERTVNARYQEFWQLKQYGDVVNGQLVLKDSSLEAFRSRAAAAQGASDASTLTAQQIRQYASDEYTTLTSFFTYIYGSAWQNLTPFTAYNSGYSYTVPSASVKSARTLLASGGSLDSGVTTESLTQGASWNPTVFVPSGTASDQPNIDAGDLKTVTLSTNGTGNSTQTVLTSVTLTPAQISQLSSDDVYDPIAHTLTITNTTPTTIAGNSYIEVENFGTGIASYYSFSNLNIKKLLNVDGDIILRAKDNILLTNDASTPALQGTGNLTMQAENGSIGTLMDPITYALRGSDSLVNASAINGDIYLKRVKYGDGDTGDMVIGSIQAKGIAHLDSDGGISTVANGAVAADSLITISSGAQELTGRVNSFTGSNGNGNISLINTAENLTLNNLSATDGDLYVNTSGSLLVSSDLQTATDRDITLLAGGGESIQAALKANGAGIINLATVNPGGDISISAAIESGSGAVTISAKKDITVANAVKTAGEVDLTADGTISETGSGHIDASILNTTSGGWQQLTGANTVDTFQAGSTGTDAITLTNTIGTLEITGIQSNGGNIIVNNTGDIAVAGKVKTSGNVDLTATGRITEKSGSSIGSIGADVLTISSHGGLNLIGPNQVASLGATNTGAGDIVFNNISKLLTVTGLSAANGNMDVETDGALVLNTALQAAADKNITLTAAGGDIALAADMIGGGDIEVLAGRNITLDHVLSTSGSAKLTAGGSIAETGDGKIYANSLTAASSGGQVLNGDNTVYTFYADNKNGGGIGFTNTVPGLKITGITQHDGGNIAVYSSGTFEIAGDVKTSDAVELTSGGEIYENDPGVGRVLANKLKTTSNGLYLYGKNEVNEFEAMNNGTGSTYLQNTAGQLTVAALTAGNGEVLIQNTGDLLVNANITTGNQKAISLLATGKETLQGALAANDGGLISLVSGQSMELGNTVTTTGEVSLDATGTITENVGSIAAGKLLAKSVGGQTLNGNNRIVQFEAYNQNGGSIELTNTASTVHIDRIYQQNDGNIAVNQTGVIELTDPITVDTITTKGDVILTASDAIYENGGRISANMLTADSRNGQDLQGNNQVAFLNATNNGGDIAFKNTASVLNIKGISQTNGGKVAVNQTGTINLTGALTTTGDVVLTATNVIGESGQITANMLTTVSNGAQTLNGANTVHSFNATNTGSGNIEFTNMQSPLIITGMSQNNGNVLVINNGDVMTTGEVNTAANGSITLTAVGKETIGAAVTVGGNGNVVLTANGTDSDIVLNAAVQTASGNITATAGRDIVGNTIDLKGKNIVLTAQAGSIGENGKAAKVTASGVLNASAQKNIYLVGEGDLTVDQMQAAGGDITLAASGDLKVNEIQAVQGDVDLKAQNIYNVAAGADTVNAIAKNLTLTAEAGDIGKVAAPVSVTVSGVLTATAQKDINLISKGALLADKVISRTGTINVKLPQGDALRILETQADKGINIRGDIVTLDNVIHTGTNYPLSLDISGATKHMADSVTVNVNSQPGVQFNNLTADKATITANTDKVVMINTNIGSRADVSNHYYHIATDSRPQNLYDSDVVLYQMGNSYNLSIDGRTISTDATILNSKGGIMLNGSANQDTAVTVADRVARETIGIKTSDIWQAGDIRRSGESILSTSIMSPVQLVDTAKITTSETDVTDDMITVDIQ